MVAARIFLRVKGNSDTPRAKNSILSVASQRIKDRLPKEEIDYPWGSLEESNLEDGEREDVAESTSHKTSNRCCTGAPGEPNRARQEPHSLV